MKASINALKGYNFQGTIYGYLLCLMDLERKIIELDASLPKKEVSSLIWAELSKIL